MTTTLFALLWLTPFILSLPLPPCHLDIRATARDEGFGQWLFFSQEHLARSSAGSIACNTSLTPEQHQHLVSLQKSSHLNLPGFSLQRLTVELSPGTVIKLEKPWIFDTSSDHLYRMVAPEGNAVIILPQLVIERSNVHFENITFVFPDHYVEDSMSPEVPFFKRFLQRTVEPDSRVRVDSDTHSVSFVNCHFIGSYVRSMLSLRTVESFKNNTVDGFSRFAADIKSAAAVSFSREGGSLYRLLVGDDEEEDDDDN